MEQLFAMQSIALPTTRVATFYIIIHQLKIITVSHTTLSRNTKQAMFHKWYQQLAISTICSNRKTANHQTTRNYIPAKINYWVI